MNSVYHIFWIHTEIMCIPKQNCLFIILGYDSGAIRRYGFAVKVRSMLPHDLLQLRRELRNVPLYCDIERQAASNHGLASIADPVRISHGIDVLDSLSSEVQNDCLAWILYGPGPARPLTVLDRLVLVLLPHFRLSYI
jgi:hypothetical protein